MFSRICVASVEQVQAARLSHPTTQTGNSVIQIQILSKMEQSVDDSRRRYGFSSV